MKYGLVISFVDEDSQANMFAEFFDDFNQFTAQYDDYMYMHPEASIVGFQILKSNNPEYENDNVWISF